MILQPLFVLQFDRILAPSSVARTNYRIVSGTSKDLSFKQIRVDPVERTVVFNVEEPLLPSIEYQLIVSASSRPSDQLAAYDGTPFEGTFTVRFSTRASSTEVETDIDPVPGDACEALATLQRTCTGSQCHGETGAEAGAPPAMGLSFASPEALATTAIGKPSILVQNAASPRTGSSLAPFPYGMQLVVPRESSSSFLLYKILMDPNLRVPDEQKDAPIPPADPTLAVGTTTAETFVAVGRDLSRVIPGAPMPHPELGFDPKQTHYEPLPVESVRLLRAWIDQGAPSCGGSSGDAGTADASADASPDASSDAMDGSAADASATDAADGG